MPVNFRDIPKQNGKYGPTDSGKFYMPNPVHNPTAAKRPDKTRWIISEPHQFCVFEEADLSKRLTEDGLLGLHIVNCKLEILGDEGEKIGFFPKPQNEDEPWHGYPERMRRLGDSFDNFFISLREAGHIQPSVCRKLLKKQI
ncbi:MAG: hypothetical protein K2N35_02030 [Muribaculaceae bacterium]|nr:hypothetical protein [Muribaculaceae bacterium]